MTESPWLSAAQVDRLGERMRGSDVISESDLTLLQEFRAEHVDALRAVQSGVSAAFPELLQASRIKTIQTLHDKLRRQPTKLSRMQDIAGIRIVKEMDLLEQDELAAELVAQFPGAKVQDRRATPSFGYRAVHVIVRIGRCSVEIQIRTRNQDLWAQIVERLGDRWGRQIRYGEVPSDPDVDIGGGTRRQFWETVVQWAEVIATVEDTIATHNFVVRQGLEPGVAAFDPADLGRQIATSLADLAEFVDRFEGL